MFVTNNRNQAGRVGLVLLQAMDQQVEEEDQDHLQGERRGGVTYEHFNDGDDERDHQNPRRQFQRGDVRL